MVVLVSNKAVVAILAGIGAVAAASVLVVKVLAKPARLLRAEPSEALPGGSWILYISGFLPPTATIVVQGYLTNPDMTFIRNLRPDGSAELNFTVELDRPPGRYWVSVMDAEAGATIWFTVLP